MRLLQVLAQQQDPHLLRKFIPDTVATYLQEVDADQFANAFFCLTNCPEIIWNDRMLSILQDTAVAHTQDYAQRLHSDPFAVYEFRDMEAIEYPGLDQELRCGNYYVRNVIENPEWNIENVEEVLRDALEQIPTVQRSDQVVLMRACSVLFKKKRYRKKDTIKNFEGYPIVLRLLDLNRERPDLSAENIELMNAAAELVFYSVWTSDENLTKFLKLKGLSSLCNLLWCCSRHAQSCYSILVFVLKIVCRLLPNPITRDQVALNTDIIRDILSCLTVGQPFEIVTLAMQCLIELSQEDRLADAVFRNGGHFYLLDFMLAFYPDAAPESEENKNNQLAVSACLVLGNISGVYKTAHEPTTTVEQKVQNALTVLLTKGNVARMRNTSEFLFVNDLYESYESPESIWNESVRNELAAFIRSRIQAHQHSQQVESDELQLVYQAHAQELQVDGVFLRYYVQQPEWRLQNARSFVIKLLEEIAIPNQGDDRMTLLLQSLYCVLTETQGQEKLIVSTESLDQFFAILSTASSHSLQSLILSIFLHATANQSCVDAICASNRFPQFVAFLQHAALEQRRILLEVVSNMVSCSSRAVEAITTSGLVLYLLQFVLNAEDEQLCGQALGVLKQTKASSGLDTRFLNAVTLFLPAYLVALLDRPAHFLHFLQKDVRSPNIIWNSTNRGHVQSAVQQALSQFQGTRSQEWMPSSVQALDFAALNQQLAVGGVYVDEYLAAPQSKLHNPALFLDQLFESLSSNISPDIVKKLLECLSHLLTHASAWAHYVAKVPAQALQTMLSYFTNGSMDENTHRALLRVTIILAHVPACRKKFHQTNIMSQLLHTAQQNVAFEELVIRTIYLLLKKEPAFVKQVLESSGGMAQIVKAADRRNTEAARYAHAAIKAMVADRKYDAQVRQMLAGREQLLNEKIQLPKPEWVSVSPLTPAMQTLYIEPFDADPRSQQMAAMQKMSSTTSIPSLQAAAASQPSSTTPKAKMAPLERPAPVAVTPIADSVPPPMAQMPAVTLEEHKPLPAPPGGAPPPRPTSMAPPEIPPASPSPSAGPTPFDAMPPPPPTSGLPPPPPSHAPAKPPPATGGRAALLDSIVKGKSLKKVDIEAVEQRKKQPASSSDGGSSSGGGGDLMNALAGALAARRTALITDLAANPFDDDDGDDDGSEDWD